MVAGAIAVDFDAVWLPSSVDGALVARGPLHESFGSLLLPVGDVWQAPSSDFVGFWTKTRWRGQGYVRGLGGPAARAHTHL